MPYSEPSHAVAAERKLTAKLREAAVGYAEYGWPVLPVSWPIPDRPIASHPAPNPLVAHDWWSRRPYGIGCVVGEVFDALELPCWLGDRLLATSAAERRPPTIEVPLEGTLLVLVTPGARRIPELPASCGVRLRQPGTWVLLPPTPVLGGAVGWASKPRPHADRPGVWLPHSLNVQWTVHRAVVDQRRGAVATT